MGIYTEEENDGGSVKSHTYPREISFSFSFFYLITKNNFFNSFSVVRVWNSIKMLIGKKYIFLTKFSYFSKFLWACIEKCCHPLWIKVIPNQNLFKQKTNYILRIKFFFLDYCEIYIFYLFMEGYLNQILLTFWVTMSSWVFRI